MKEVTVGKSDGPYICDSRGYISSMDPTIGIKDVEMRTWILNDLAAGLKFLLRGLAFIVWEEDNIPSLIAHFEIV